MIIKEIHVFQFRKQKIGQRDCFHPGASNLAPSSLHGAAHKEVGGWQMIRAMLSYVWPKDKPGVKARVIIAAGLLIGAKVKFLQTKLNHEL